MMVRGVACAALMGVMALGAVAYARRGVETTPPNVLLISIDALRADHLSCYGYDRHTSPVLDDLAAHGIRFSKAFVNTHGTAPSHTTLLSSLYQETHSVDLGRDDGAGSGHIIPAEVNLVQEILKRNGWRTVAVTGGGYMSGKFGFSRGFDEFTDKGTRGIAAGAHKLVELLGLPTEDARPVFALLHTYEVHSPYVPPEGFADLFGEYSGTIEPTNKALIPIYDTAGQVLTRGDFEYLESLYDGGIRYTDKILGELLDELKATGFLDNALVIITADHGEEFGEHGGLLHAGKLYEELIHVPLIVFGTGAAQGVVDPTLVSLVDVAQTILTAARVPVPEVMEGRNLLNSSHPQSWLEQRVFLQYASQLYCVRTPRWKLIFEPANGLAELFDLRRDPVEHVNLADIYPEVAKTLLAEIAAWRRERPKLEFQETPVDKLSAEKIEELRALGYVE
jgi:arylsulfatase A-like enzyme